MVLQVDGWPPEHVPSVQDQARLGIENLVACRSSLRRRIARSRRCVPALAARADERPTGSA